MNTDTLNDQQWLLYILAESEPLEDKPDVRELVFDRYVDVLRIARIFAARDSDGNHLFKQLKRLPPSGLQLFSGVASRGNIVITYAGYYFCHESGEHAAKLFVDFGSEKDLDFMTKESDNILDYYRQTLAEWGQHPVNHRYN
jgi:hypothetical protein